MTTPIGALTTSSRVRVALGLILAAALIGLWRAPATYAAGVVGNGTAASCTEQALRSAIAAGGSISFNCGSNPVTITLSSELDIRTAVDINGGNKITLSGAGAVRIMHIQETSATLRNLTFRDGLSDKGGAIQAVYFADVTILGCSFLNNRSDVGYQEEGGGAISMHVGTLTIRDSLFQGNRGTNGGAIYNLLTPLTIEDSTFINNDSTHGSEEGASFGGGGAITTDGASYPLGSGGTITIRNTIFRGNRASGSGGAAFTYVYPPADKVIIAGSTFEDNSAASGGAVRHGNGPLTLSDSLFSQNHATSSGGAFWASAADGTRIENVTFVNNEVRTSNARGMGGALYLASGSFDLVNTTIANNYADFYAGAIFADSDNVALWNTIVANNRANDGTRWNQCGRTLTRGAHNIMFPQGGGDNSGDYLCAPNISHSDPKLSALADNGGPTATMALLAGSPAINAGASCPATDQRGAARVGVCDLGAFEYGGVPPGTTPPASAPVLQAVDDDNSPLLEAQWSSVDGATFYQVEVSGAAPKVAPAVISVADNSIATIVGKGTYSVRVRACNNIGCSGYSAAESATITIDPERLWLPLTRR